MLSSQKLNMRNKKLFLEKIAKDDILNLNFNQVRKCIIMIRHFIGNILTILHQ